MRPWSNKLFQLQRLAFMQHLMLVPRSWLPLTLSEVDTTAQSRLATTAPSLHQSCHASISSLSSLTRRRTKRTSTSPDISSICTGCRTRPSSLSFRWHSSKPTSRCAGRLDLSSQESPHSSSKMSTRSLDRAHRFIMRLLSATPSDSLSLSSVYLRPWLASMLTQSSGHRTSRKLADCSRPQTSTL